MIRRSARNDPTAGSVIFDKPLVKAIEEYQAENASESLQKRLQEAFDTGYRAGYQQALVDRLGPLDPSSEYAR